MKKISLSINLLLVIVIILLLGSGAAVANNPGSTSDPIVTQSYVEGRIKALSDDVDERLAALESQPSGDSVAFKVLEVKVGQIIHLEENSLFILRAGEALAIAGQGGGLSDLTTGYDVGTDSPVELNHLLLTPKTDGRGVKMTYDGWVMISGGYTIE
ncbi:hypothetical protein EZV73_16425 [Acidaminobacter sp. JC074]|uniref:hypothetical protein n=1 Tax=Acidaminobacter sp. JC074 TaxID=2530199 RepID=UPI001F0D2AE2|nr:hypothetical protein [Acidaminobacter sp. JC074]MCH4889183.1 hypothetical protein [Acidaminobacter sp. JC074]